MAGKAGQDDIDVAGAHRGAPRRPLIDHYERIALLRDILRDDAHIRARAEPWLRNLEQFLS